MAKLIAITGTHGTGKTTLSFQLAAEYKKLGANVKVIQEVARICPFPINDGMTKQAALWIYHEHSKKQLEACRDHDVIICDRTICDSFAYAQYFGIEIDFLLVDSAILAFRDYDKLYFVKPDIPLSGDGIRSKDLHFQKGIDEILEGWIKPFVHTKTLSSEIFNKDTQWTISL